MYLRTRANKHLFTHTCIYIYPYKHVCLYIHICMYIYIHTCAYIYIYIYRERERETGHAHGGAPPPSWAAVLRQVFEGVWDKQFEGICCSPPKGSEIHKILTE